MAYKPLFLNDNNVVSPQTGQVKSKYKPLFSNEAETTPSAALQPQKPQTIISTAPVAQPKKETFLTKVAKAVLPKLAEDYFGLSEKKDYLTPMEAENAKQSYFREQRKKGNIAKITVPKEKYTPPTTFAGKTMEVKCWICKRVIH